MLAISNIRNEFELKQGNQIDLNMQCGPLPQSNKNRTKIYKRAQGKQL